MKLTDEAVIKNDIRVMYKDIGYEGCLRVLEESMIFNNLLLDVLLEEMVKRSGGSNGKTKL